MRERKGNRRRNREKNGKRGARKKRTKGRDMRGQRRKERTVHHDVTYRSGSSSTSLGYSRLASAARLSNLPLLSPEDCRNVRAKSAAHCM